MERKTSTTPVTYPEAMAIMDGIVDAIIAQRADPVHIWYLEHPSLYTAGSSAKAEDLLEKNRLPVFQTGRGGQYTYHGPGQLIVYCMVDLNALQLDVRQYVQMLEQWVLRVLSTYGITGFLDPSKIGVWVLNPKTGREDKIAALGIRVRKGVAYHGLAFNRAPDLTHYTGIVPCGLSNFGVTSLEKQGIHTTLNDLICAFEATLPTEFA